MNENKRALVISFVLICVLLLTGLTGCTKERPINHNIAPSTHSEEPNEEVAAQEETILNYWNNHKQEIELSALQLTELYDQYSQHDYYYNIADEILYVNLVIPDGEPEEISKRAAVEKALQDSFSLIREKTFERVLINHWSFDVPFCEFSGFLELYDKTGCYVSLGYFPSGEPSSKQLKRSMRKLRMLDESWALITSEKQRLYIDQGLLPDDKASEIWGESYARQEMEQYRFFKDNRETLERIAEGMLELKKEAPQCKYSYDFLSESFTAFDKQSNNTKEVSPSVALWEPLKELSSIDSIPFEDVSIQDYSNRKIDGLCCVFYGKTQFIQDFGFWYDLCYTRMEAPEEVEYHRVIKIDAHWFLMSEENPS